MKRFYPTVSISLFCITVFLFAGCQPEQQVEEKTAVRPVRFVELSTSSGEQNRTFSGTARAGKKSALSFKVSGTIEKIPVQVGDIVSRGDILAEVDPTDFSVNYDGAVAGLKSAEADAEAAKTSVQTTMSNYSRVEKLYESSNVSLSEFEQARGEYETAQAQLQAALSGIKTAQTQLEAAENQLQYTKLKAPFDGVVNTVDLEENEEVTPGTTVVTLSGLGTIDVVVNLSDIYIASVARGMVVNVSFPAIPDSSCAGVVTEIPYAASDAPTYPITLRIEDKSESSRLRPGMAADVVFSFTSKTASDGLFLPTDAVGEEAGANFVFVIETEDDKTGVVKKQAVKLGELSELGFKVESGLSGGELIATSGLQMLLDGMNVALKDDPVNNW